MNNSIAAMRICLLGIAGWLASAGPAPAQEQLLAPKTPDIIERLERLEKLNETLLKQNQDLKKELQSIKAPEAATSTGVNKSEVQSIVSEYLLQQAEKEKKEKAKTETAAKETKVEQFYSPLFPWLHHPADHLDLESLYDSLSQPADTKKLGKLSIKGYTQFRFGRTLDQDEDGAEPNLFGDRTINGRSENFLIRRMRFVFSGDVSEHLYVYIQPDFASSPQGSTTSTFFAQLRDAYADVYVDKTKVNRFRVGLSKIPYGFENCQSSQNRIPLDRTDAINSAVAPNERDLGVIYYWTPQEKQKLFKSLVDGGLKGSNNFGVFALGVYDGQGGSVPEANLNLHMVSRFTYPIQLPSGQVVEAGIQGYRGNYLVAGSSIRPLGVGGAIVPKGTGGDSGILEQRVAGHFVWFPQPFGFQAEWQVGEGPGLNDAQTEVVTRPLSGGYVMGMYRHETSCHGIFTPYCRYQQYTGGYRNIANAPYGHQRQLDLGVEWQIRKEMELVVEYSFVNTPNFTAINVAGRESYRDFEGGTLRFQFQINY